jgi:hypothetical protein
VIRWNTVRLKLECVFFQSTKVRPHPKAINLIGKQLDPSDHGPQGRTREATMMSSYAPQREYALHFIDSFESIQIDTVEVHFITNPNQSRCENLLLPKNRHVLIENGPLLQINQRHW